MLRTELNSPLDLQRGRLFDAVASFSACASGCRFEGQAAMELEFALEGIETDESYPLPIADYRLPFKVNRLLNRHSSWTGRR